MESVNQFAKIGKLRSENTVIKKLSIITEVSTISAFVAAFDAKALNCTELLESYLAGGNRIINCHTRAYAKGRVCGLTTPLELDILQKLYYLCKEIKCFCILFAC